jgi:hypothetical protein
MVPVSLHYVQCSAHFRGASSHAPYNALAISLVANPKFPTPQTQKSVGHKPELL